MPCGMSNERVAAMATIDQAQQTLTFPDGFRWGVATSSHQYEGGNTNNQWYAWEQAGHIRSGDRCGLACDWWANAERDFDRAQAMGLNALRLSLEWSRIEPRMDEWDAEALQRYRQMLQALHERGIEPMVTLHHFTDPLWFTARGGFLAGDAPERFERYVTHAVEALGDLCDFWCTINEPNIYAIVGYQIGRFPPGHHGDLRNTIRVQASMARAHAAAYHAIHRLQPAARVGWAQNFGMFDPIRPTSRLDRFIAHMAEISFNDLFPRAIQTGAASFPYNLFAGDLRKVQGTCDYAGINTYYRDLVGLDLRQPWQPFKRIVASGAPLSDQPIGISWGEVYPQGIARAARLLAPLGKPIYVTESGVADRADRLRPWQIAAGVRAMHEAIAEGIDLRGYYHWSLVDNFEWAEGWSTRFGLIALDPETQERTPRRSAAFYSAIAQANALTLEMLREYVPNAFDAPAVTS